MKTIEYKGHTITVEWERDNDLGAPWENEDGHGPVSDWTRRSKNSGERTLCHDRGSSRYYDFAEATKIAKRGGWGLHPKHIAELAAKLGRKPTKKEITTESVERDFEFLRRWCNDDWWYSGYTIEIDGKHFDSLWGIDSDSQPEFERDAISQAQKWIDNETKEQADSACRDIETVAA